ncbi:MAG: Crp/Fnr family transcriptional regulator, partial [Rhodobacteraceae bacterium]|nr:Crp/Fnr family transcriptional regulator [Paracoccaceae bacterium]
MCIRDRDYSGEAVAAAESRLVLVPRDLFLALMDTSPAFRGFVFAAFAARMQGTMQVLERVAFQRIESRLARTLLDLAEDGLVRATHQDLALRLGTAREVVSRRLLAMEDQGLVATERGQVRLIDPRRLRLMAEAFA